VINQTRDPINRVIPLILSIIEAVIPAWIGPYRAGPLSQSPTRSRARASLAGHVCLEQQSNKSQPTSAIGHPLNSIRVVLVLPIHSRHFSGHQPQPCDVTLETLFRPCLCFASSTLTLTSNLVTSPSTTKTGFTFLDAIFAAATPRPFPAPTPPSPLTCELGAVPSTTICILIRASRVCLSASA